MSSGHESAGLTYSPPDSVEARKQIFDLMNHYQATEEEKERSLGLFLRGSLLARIMATADIYQCSVKICGHSMSRSISIGELCASIPSRGTRGFPKGTNQLTCIVMEPIHCLAVTTQNSSGSCLSCMSRAMPWVTSTANTSSLRGIVAKLSQGSLGKTPANSWRSHFSM